MKFGPPPAHPIGIWLGAYGPRMMRVVGRLADGWFPSLPRLPLDEVPGRMRLIDEAAERAGRDPRSIRRIANLGGEITERPPSQVIEELGALREQGFDGFLVGTDQVAALRRRGRSRPQVCVGKPEVDAAWVAGSGQRVVTTLPRV